MSYRFFIALRYLRARRGRRALSIITAISVVGLAVGVWALVSVLAFQSGMEQELRTRILIGTAHLNVLRQKNLPLDDPAAVERIRRIPHVAAATVTGYEGAMISGVEHSGLGIFKSVDPTENPKDLEVTRTLLPGGDVTRLARTAYPDGGELPGAIVGKNLAEDVGIRVGDTIQALTSGNQGELTPVGVLPRSFALKVVGIFESGLYEYDSAWVYISTDTAREMFGDGGRGKVIQVTLDDLFRSKEVGADIAAALGSDYVVKDWRELNQPAFAALNLQRLGFAVGISLIVLVASLNIVTTLIMLVVEKRRDIAILTAMGATAGDILTIFLFQGMAIGLVGTAIGGAFGLATAIVGDRYKLIQLDPRTYSISYVPFRLAATDTLLVLAIALGISFLATLYPAWRASRLDPVEGIRYG